MRRWQTTIAVAAALAIGAARQAPAQMIGFGVMAGGSLSTFTGNTISDVKHYATFIGGAFVRLGPLQPGIYYTGKGAQTADLAPTAGATTKLSYIQIPIVIRIPIGPLYIGGGPAIGYNLDCKITVNGGEGDCASFGGFDASKTEYSGIAEAGLRFRHFSIGGRADLGLSNVFTKNAGSVDVKTQTISAVVALTF